MERRFQKQKLSFVGVFESLCSFRWFLLLRLLEQGKRENPGIEKQLTFLKETCAGEALFLFERWLNAKSWFNTYDFCALSFKSPWRSPKASRKKGVEGQTKRATCPLGAISTSCLVPSSQGLSSGLLWFVWFLFRGPFLVTRLSTVGVVSVCGGEALLSIPHETQWTIQALPTVLSVQQQYQR